MGQSFQQIVFEEAERAGLSVVGTHKQEDGVLLQGVKGGTIYIRYDGVRRVYLSIDKIFLLQQDCLVGHLASNNHSLASQYIDYPPLIAENFDTVFREKTLPRFFQFCHALHEASTRLDGFTEGLNQHPWPKPFQTDLCCSSVRAKDCDTIKILWGIRHPWQSSEIPDQHSYIDVVDPTTSPELWIQNVFPEKVKDLQPSSLKKIEDFGLRIVETQLDDPAHPRILLASGPNPTPAYVLSLGGKIVSSATPQDPFCAIRPLPLSHPHQAACRGEEFQRNIRHLAIPAKELMNLALGFSYSKI